jgi:hypothetical protein
MQLHQELTGASYRISYFPSVTPLRNAFRNSSGPAQHGFSGMAQWDKSSVTIGAQDDSQEVVEQCRNRGLSSRMSI